MRCLSFTLFAGTLLLTSSFPALASELNFSGTWQVNAAQSQTFEGAATKVVIDQQGNQISFKKWTRERDGQLEESSFTCAIGGVTCDYTEGKHHSKVSLWYDGSSLVMLKTDGPRDRETTERSFTLSSDGKSLTMQFSNVAGGNNKKKLVFNSVGRVSDSAASSVS